MSAYEYIVQGNYGHGWDELTTEATWAEARAQLRCYNDNEPRVPHRIIRARITEETTP